MILSKKSQGLSVTTVIIAALALIVLIILILIFSGRISIFNKGVMECAEGSTKSVGTPCSENTAYEELPVKLGEEKQSDGTVKIVYCCKTKIVATS